jgi:hypothetical protein
MKHDKILVRFNIGNIIAFDFCRNPTLMLLTYTRQASASVACSVRFPAGLTNVTDLLSAGRRLSSLLVSVPAALTKVTDLH